MDAVKETFKNMEKLVSEGVLTQSEADEMKKDYKNQIKESIADELAKAKEEGDLISKAAENEVNSKIKNMTPIIYGSPVIVSPTPPQAGIKSAAFLSEVPKIAKDLVSIINKINSVIG